MSQTKQVLIVDDRHAVRRALKALLALWPEVACVGEAADGQEAVKLVAEQHPDTVLMDIRMQGMDGLEATRHIKSRWPEVRVIVLTLRAEHEEEALAAGADVFLVKGGPPEALREAISRALTHRGAGGSGRIQGDDARQRSDRAVFGPSMRSPLLRKEKGRPANNITGVIPWYGGVAS